MPETECRQLIPADMVDEGLARLLRQELQQEGDLSKKGVHGRIPNVQPALRKCWQLLFALSAMEQMTAARNITSQRCSP